MPALLVIGVVVLGAMAFGGGVEWMLTRLDIVIYVAVGLIIVGWLYRVIRNRYLDWLEDQDREEQARRQIEAKRQELEDGRRRLREAFEASMAEAQRLEDRIFTVVRNLLPDRHDQGG